MIAAALFAAALTVASADRLAMADRLFNRGEYAAARAEYRALAGADGVSAETLAYREVYCAYQLGEKKDARRLALDFLKRFPASDDAGQVRFLGAMSAEDPADRRRELSSLDADGTPTRLRTLALCELGNLTGEAAYFERCFKLAPDGSLADYAKFRHALCLSQSKVAAERRKATEELVDLAFGKKGAMSADALYSAASLTFYDQRYGEAVALAKRFLKAYPDDSDRCRQLRIIAASSEYNAGRYASAVEFCGEEHEERFDLVRALALDRFGDRDRAVAAAEDYLARHPQGEGRERMELLLARSDFDRADQNGDVKKLVEAARRAAELSKSAADRVRYGWTLERAGESAKAEEVYASVARDFPGAAEAADALYRRGMSLARRDRWSAAEVAFAEALAAKLPEASRALALYWRGVACLKLDHSAEGEKYLREAVAEKLPPDELREARLMLADADFNAGRREAALAAYTELVRLGATERMNSAKILAIGKLLAPAEMKLCADALTAGANAEWRQAGWELAAEAEDRLGNATAAAAAREKCLAENCVTESAAAASLQLGLYRLSAGETAEADRELRRSVELNVKNDAARAAAYLALARVAIERGDREAARGYATVVAELFEKEPAAAEARALLEKLGK